LFDSLGLTPWRLETNPNPEVKQTSGSILPAANPPFQRANPVKAGGNITACHLTQGNCGALTERCDRLAPPLGLQRDVGGGLGHSFGERGVVFGTVALVNQKLNEPWARARAVAGIAGEVSRKN